MGEKEKLYSVLKDQGLYTKSFEEFQEQYSPEDEESFDKLFSVISERGLYTKSKEEFTNKYYGDSKKKDDTQLASSSDQDVSESTEESFISEDQSEPPPSERPKLTLRDRVEKDRESNYFMNTMGIWGDTFQNIGNSVAIAAVKLAGYAQGGAGAIMADATSMKIAQAVDENNKQIEAQKIARAYDPELSFEENVSESQKGIIDSYNEGNYGEALGKVAIGAIDSMPYLATSVLTGGVGGTAATAGTFFATGYGGTLAEEYLKDANVDAVDHSKAIVQGAIEGFASIIGGGASKYAKDMVRSLGKETAKKVIKNNMKAQGAKAFGKEFAKTSMGEGFEEFTQEFSSKVVDDLYEGNGVDWETAGKIGLEAFLIGAASGGGVATAGGGFKAGYNKYRVAKAKVLTNEKYQKVASEIGLQSTKDNPKKEAELKKMKDNLLKDVKLNNVSDEDAKRLNDLTEEVMSSDDIINATQDKDVRKELIDKKLQKVEEINDILNKYDDKADPEVKKKSELNEEKRVAESKVSKKESELKDLKSRKPSKGTKKKVSVLEEELRAEKEKISYIDNKIKESTEEEVNVEEQSKEEAKVDEEVKEEAKPKIDPDQLKDFDKKTKISFSKIKDDSAFKAGKEKVSLKDVGLDQEGELTIKRAYPQVKKKIKKYEAVQKCLIGE